MRPVVLLLAALVVAPLASAADRDVLAERQRELDVDGELPEGASAVYDFDVTEQDVTSVAFELSWDETGDAAHLTRPDAFSLTVMAPGGHVVGQARSSTGALAVVSTLGGSGTWRATLKLEDAGNPVGARLDKGNAFHLAVRIGHLERVHVATAVGGAPTGLASADHLGLASLGAVLLLGVPAVVLWARRAPPRGDNKRSPKP